jgi:hypothetical protein
MKLLGDGSSCYAKGRISTSVYDFFLGIRAMTELSAASYFAGGIV